MSNDDPLAEPRFLQPPGWHWQTFNHPAGHRLRFGSVSPPGNAPAAIVVGLQGLSEFTEKYFEVAHDLLARNLGFCMMDWRGHGHSDRYLDNPHRRHSLGFDQDIADLHYFIEKYVRPAAIHPDGTRIPLVMLAHSMGGHIGLRYLHEHPGIFTAAAFSAAMVGIKALGTMPPALLVPATTLLSLVAGNWYVFGGGDWRASLRDITGDKILTADPVRCLVHNAWCMRDHSLQVGNITYRWLHEAFVSTLALQKPGVAQAIKTPVLFGLAGRERLVDNTAIRHFAAAMPDATVIDLPESYHEIFMERDASRNEFFAAFDRMLVAQGIKITS